jgi:hypothetical protein
MDVDKKNLAGTIHLSGLADFVTPCNTNINRIRSMAIQYYRVFFILATLVGDFTLIVKFAKD